MITKLPNNSPLNSKVNEVIELVNFAGAFGLIVDIWCEGRLGDGHWVEVADLKIKENKAYCKLCNVLIANMKR